MSGVFHVFVQMTPRGLQYIRNNFFGYILLFSNNSLLFYMKIEICFLHKVVSYMRESTLGYDIMLN